MHDVRYGIYYSIKYFVCNFPKQVENFFFQNGQLEKPILGIIMKYLQN